MLESSGEWAISGKRHTAGQTMEQHYTQRIDITATIYHLPRSLLRRHILGRPNACSYPCEIHRPLKDFGDSKV